jgi:hypothetical protein
MRFREWINLVETQGIENSILADDFKWWFKNSKVVDADGRPMICYHGTFNNFDEFQSGSHFGDLKAANTRIDNVRSGGSSRFTNHLGGIIPVYLRIQNPLRIVDNAGLTDGFDLVTAALTAQAISKEESEDCERNSAPVVAKRRLFNLLSKKGYDGMVYKNTVEGNADSWIVFYPSQVKSIYNQRFSTIRDGISD